MITVIEKKIDTITLKFPKKYAPFFNDPGMIEMIAEEYAEQIHTERLKKEIASDGQISQLVSKAKKILGEI